MTNTEKLIKDFYKMCEKEEKKRQRKLEKQKVKEVKK